jgi:hypothetical protein
MTIQKAPSLAAGIAAILILTGAANAQQLGFAACKADIRTLCEDASGLAGRLQCLKTNQDKLSPECMGAIRAVLGAVQSKAAAVENAPQPLAACQQDLATLCPDIKAGEGGRIRCLRDNSPKLSPGCSDALKAARAQSKNALTACEADRNRLCSSAGGKPADQLKCLREKVGELGAECRKLVEIVRPAKAKAPVKEATPPAGIAPASPSPPAAATLPPSPAPPAALPAPRG